MPKKFDVIIFGASGYTGKYAIRESIKILKDLNWAVAGRNKEKLENILQEIGIKLNADLSKIPIVVADVMDEKSIREMTAQAKVIVNCCGPYYLYGEIVIKACIESSTSHVDLSGEPQFIEKMQLKYHDLAQEKGIYIISPCGLESIPVEMGIEYMERNFNGTLNSVESYLRMFMNKDYKLSGALLNSGTYFSGIQVVANFFELIKIRRQLNYNPLPKLKPKLYNRLIHKKKIGEKSFWSLPLIEPDPSVVKKTQRHFYEKDNKRPIQIHSYIVVNKLYEVFGFIMIALFILLLAPLKFTRKLLLNYPEYFTFGIFTNQGPKEEIVENMNFEMTLIGRGWKKETFDNMKNNNYGSTDKEVRVVVSGSNPAYGSTSVALLLSAKTILFESSKIPHCGVITPGIAFKNTTLIEQLKKHGVSIDIIEVVN